MIVHGVFERRERVGGRVMSPLFVCSNTLLHEAFSFITASRIKNKSVPDFFITSSLWMKKKNGKSVVDRWRGSDRSSLCSSYHPKKYPNSLFLFVKIPERSLGFSSFLQHPSTGGAVVTLFAVVLLRTKSL